MARSVKQSAPQLMYHVTRPDRLKKINQQGIVPNSYGYGTPEQNSQNVYDYGSSHTFFFDNLDDAKNYVGANGYARPNAILTVNTEGLPLAVDDHEQNAWRYPGLIPPERITGVAHSFGVSRFDNPWYRNAKQSIYIDDSNWNARTPFVVFNNKWYMGEPGTRHEDLYHDQVYGANADSELRQHLLDTMHLSPLEKQKAVQNQHQGEISHGHDSEMGEYIDVLHPNSLADSPGYHVMANDILNHYKNTVTTEQARYASDPQNKLSKIAVMRMQAEHDYRGQHKAPGPEGAPFHAADIANDDSDYSGAFPSDIYEHPEWYGLGNETLRDETVQQLFAARGNPDHPVTIYRAAPKPEFNTGDWVTPSLEYAKGHAMADENPSHDMPVHSITVPAKHLNTNADYLPEWGYNGPSTIGSRIAHRIAAADHAGCMIALYLDPQLANKIALDDGEPADDLHITVIYFVDKAAQRNDWDNAIRVAQQVCSGFPPLKGTIQGTGRFQPEKDEHPIIGLVNISDIRALHDKLLIALEDSGFPVSQEYDFNPHITLKYVGADEPDPEMNIDLPIEINFAQAEFVMADQRTDLPLGGSESLSNQLKAASRDRTRVQKIFKLAADPAACPHCGGTEFGFGFQCRNCKKFRFSAEENPTYSFAYYLSGLWVEDWHHNLRHRDLLERLLNQFKMTLDDTGWQDNGDKWTGGDIFEDGDTIRVEFKHLAAPGVQEEAVDSIKARFKDKTVKHNLDIVDDIEKESVWKEAMAWNFKNCVVCGTKLDPQDPGMCPNCDAGPGPYGPLPDVMYKGADPQKRESILQHGFHPGPDPEWGPDQLPGVYMTHNPELARNWGGDVYKIDTRGLKSYTDFYAQDAEVHPHHIPPHRIQLLENAGIPILNK